MPLALDAQSGLKTGTATWSWTHTPNGTPKGVLVLIAENVGTTDVISGVTYGGVAMSRVGRATDSTGEPGQVYAYFLGSSIPTGAQTVQVTVSSGTTAKVAVSITLTADGNTALAGTTGFATAAGDAANPSVSITGINAAHTIFAVGALFSGLNAPNMSPGTGFDDAAAALEHDFGNQTASFIYSDAAESGVTSKAVNWSAASDDVAAIGVVVRDTALSFVADLGQFSLTGNSANLLFHRKLLASQGTFTFTGNAATLQLIKILTASTGAFSLSGSSAGLLATRKLTGDGGSFVLTGLSAGLLPLMFVSWLPQWAPFCSQGAKRCSPTSEAGQRSG